LTGWIDEKNIVIEYRPPPPAHADLDRGLIKAFILKTVEAMQEPARDLPSTCP